MKIRKRLWFEIALFFVISAALILHIHQMWVRVENDQITNELEVGRSVGALIPIQDLKLLENSPADLDKPEYLNLKQLLSQIIEINSRARFAYLYTLKQNKIYFIADSEPADSKDYSPPGQEFTEASSQDFQPFRDGKALVTETVADRWGSWRSILVPIFDNQSGKVVAVFGMDYNSGNWHNRVWLEVFQASFVIILIFVFLLLFRIRNRNRLLKNDFDELFRVKEKLAKSEEKLKVITQSVHDVIFVVDKTGKQLFFNDSVETVLGYKVEELIGKSFTGFVPRSELPKYLARLKDVFLNKAVFNFETKIYHKDGHLVDVEINGRLVEIDGEYVGQGTIRDITERKAMTESLNVSLTKYQILFDTFPVGVVLTDQEGKILEANPNAEKILNLSKEEFNGRNLNDRTWKVFRPDGSPMPNTEFAGIRALNENRIVRNVEMGFLKDDEFNWINASAAPVPLDGYGVAIVYNDVTEKRLIEESLQQEQHFTQNLLDSLPGIFYLYSYPDLKLVRWNRNHTSIFGFSDAELKDWSVRDWIDPEIRGNVIHALDEAYKNGSLTSEITLLTKDRRPIPFQFSAVRIALFGRDYIMGVGFDSTEQKRAEQVIIDRNNELQQINAERNKFFSIISHDLKAPFNSIMGFTEILLDLIENNQIQEAARYTRIVLQSSKNAMDLLQNLIDWSRSQTGRMTYRPINFDLIETVETTINLFENIAAKKSIEIKAQLPEKLDICADIDMIATILRNLISNAIKYTFPDGTVSIAVDHQPGRVVVSVRDTGVGISEKMKAKIFRIDETHSTRGTLKEQGTGLGLLLCKEFVENHGGRIWFESEEGKGSTFSFSVPV